MASDERFDPRFDPAFQRGYVPKPVEAVGTPAVAPEGRRTNPWLVVLWALAILLFGVGVAGLIATEDVSNSANELTAVVYPAVVRALAPWAAGAGLLGVVLAVFVQSVQWRRA